jgi:hypothetical protein
MPHKASFVDRVMSPSVTSTYSRRLFELCSLPTEFHWSTENMDFKVLLLNEIIETSGRLRPYDHKTNDSIRRELHRETAY